jgi:hypothetical protein
MASSDEKPLEWIVGGACLQGLSCAYWSHKPNSKKIGESRWIGGTSGSQAQTGFSPIPVGLP